MTWLRVTAMVMAAGLAACGTAPRGTSNGIKWVDPDTRDVPAPEPLEQSLVWDFIHLSTFWQVGELLDLGHTGRMVLQGMGAVGPREAANVNALDEAPGSSWYTNRHALHRMSPEALAAGPSFDLPDTTGAWTIVAGKMVGVAPGFTMRDAKGRTYIVKFDGVAARELATGAELVSTRFYHAAGYNVPPNAAVMVAWDDLEIAPSAMVLDEDGVERPMNRGDIEAMMAKVPVENGRSRAVMSRYLDGKPVGVSPFHGRRGDDANDLVDHQDRRELRGLGVMAAWLNDTDRRAANTLGMFRASASANGLGHVTHYLIDFGATLGAATVGPTTPKSGNVFIVDGADILKSFMGLGFYRQAWKDPQPMPHISVGYWESEVFDPATWKTNYPNPAFQRMTDRDGYWGAKLVTAFRDADIQAIVRAGSYSNPEAEAYIARILRERRDRIGRYWFGRANPVDRFRIEGEALVFADLAVDRGLADGGTTRYRYRIVLGDGKVAAWQETDGRRLNVVRGADAVVIRTSRNGTVLPGVRVNLVWDTAGRPMIGGVLR